MQKCVIFPTCSCLLTDIHTHTYFQAKPSCKSLSSSMWFALVFITYTYMNGFALTTGAHFICTNTFCILHHFMNCLSKEKKCYVESPIVINKYLKWFFLILFTWLTIYVRCFKVCRVEFFLIFKHLVTMIFLYNCTYFQIKRYIVPYKRDWRT